MAGQVYWGLNTYRSNPEIIGDPTILLLGDSWLYLGATEPKLRSGPQSTKKSWSWRLAGMAVTLKLCY